MLRALSAFGAIRTHDLQVVKVELREEIDDVKLDIKDVKHDMDDLRGEHDLRVEEVRTLK